MGLNMSAKWRLFYLDPNGPLTKYAKLRFAHAPGMPETFSPSPRVSDSDMHHGTSVMHVSWCMTGSLTSSFIWNRWWGKHSGIPGACSTRNFAHLVRGPLVNIWLWGVDSGITIFPSAVACRCSQEDFLMIWCRWCGNVVNGRSLRGGLA